MKPSSKAGGCWVSGVILAAGSSRRLGRPKQLLDLGGEPLLWHTIRNAIRSGLSEVLVVLGSRAEEIRVAVGDVGQRTMVNPDFAEGQSTSLVVGMDAVSTEADAVVILLGDQPLVSPAAIDRLVEAYKGRDGEIVQAAYEGVPGNPVLFGRSLFGELTAVTGDEGARSVIKRHAEAVVRVEVGDVAEAIDVDTEADYAALVGRWRAHLRPSLDPSSS